MQDLKMIQGCYKYSKLNNIDKNEAHICFVLLEYKYMIKTHYCNLISQEGGGDEGLPTYCLCFKVLSF